VIGPCAKARFVVLPRGEHIAGTAIFRDPTGTPQKPPSVFSRLVQTVFEIGVPRTSSTSAGKVVNLRSNRAGRKLRGDLPFR